MFSSLANIYKTQATLIGRLLYIYSNTFEHVNLKGYSILVPHLFNSRHILIWIGPLITLFGDLFLIFFWACPHLIEIEKVILVGWSFTKAEYHSMAGILYKLSWISYLLYDFNVPLHRLIELYYDNKATVHISTNPSFHEWTKYIDIDCHIVRDHLKLVLSKQSTCPLVYSLLMYSQSLSQ